MAAAERAVRARILVTGRVQGVAFRAFTCEAAVRLGLTGGVRNLDDGRVEAEVEGPRHDVERCLEALRQGPALARVDHLDVQWQEPTGRDPDFRVWG